MAKDNRSTKPVVAPTNNPFDQFVRANLDRIVEERVDVQDTANKVTAQVAAERANVDETGKQRPADTLTAPVPVMVVPPDPITMEAMERRYLPVAFLTGTQVTPVDVSATANPMLVEAHQLLSDLLAGGMIIMSSPLIWSRVTDTTARLRAAITDAPVVPTEEVVK